jgi:hypothetical protein
VFSKLRTYFCKGSYSTHSERDTLARKFSRHGEKVDSVNVFRESRLTVGYGFSCRSVVS